MVYVEEQSWFHSSPETGVVGQLSALMLRAITPNATLNVLS